MGAVGLGWLRAAGGIGAGAVTLVLTQKPVVRRIGRTLLTAVAVFGVATIALGVTTSYWVAFAAMLVLSGADAISVFIRATLVPLVVPQEMRGRVLAVENVFIGGSNELGAFESGVAGQILGPAGAVVLGGAATVAIAGTWAFAFPALRDIDRFPGSAHPSSGTSSSWTSSARSEDPWWLSAPPSAAQRSGAASSAQASAEPDLPSAARSVKCGECRIVSLPPRGRRSRRSGCATSGSSSWARASPRSGTG